MALGSWILAAFPVWATGPRAGLTNCNGYFTALGQHLTPDDYAQIDLHRAAQAKLLYINHDLIRQDFSALRSYSDVQVEEWARQNLPYVTVYANDNKDIHHSGIPVDLQDRRQSYVPHTYGRADVMGDDVYGVDRKMIGVTYVTKGPDGRVVILPGRVTFKPDTSHQDGLGRGWEANYEIAAGEILQAATGEPDKPNGANQVYATFDLGARLYNHDDQGKVTSSDPAHMVARQLNVRFYRLPKAQAEEGRQDFLYSNARLFWKGIYHASLNRYNADKGIYLDYGTVTGVPRDAYRLTAMSHVPYGLSDFYGLFGEWSAGQAAGKAENNQSPFYPRSWGVFLANVAVGMGMDKTQTVRFVTENEAKLGQADLHELLLQMNARRAPQFRSDPTQKTFTKMDLVTITESGEQIPQHLRGLTDTADLYRAIFQNAQSKVPSPPGFYEAILRRSVHDADEVPLRELAQRMHQIEGLVRDQLAWRPGAVLTAGHAGENRIGEQLLRSRLMRDSVEAQNRVAADGHPEPVRELVDRYRRRTESADLGGILNPPPSGGDHRGMEKFTEAFARSGQVAASKVRIRTDHIDREVPFMTSNAQMLSSPEYKHLRDNSIGLIWLDSRAAGDQFRFGHSYLRIGDRIFDLSGDGKIVEHEFTAMMGKRFFYNFGMRDRSGGLAFYETVYAVSPEAKAGLLKLYTDRESGKATVDGRPVVPSFDASGRGDEWGDGIVRENCGAFATCFNHPRWMGDYPGLVSAVKDTGLSERRNGAHVGIESFFDPKAKPIAVLSWGAPGDRGEPGKQHEILGAAGAQFRSEVLQAWQRRATHPAHQKEADEVKDWAVRNGLGGFQATAFPSVNKSGELSGPSQRFNVLRLHPEKLGAFDRDVGRDSMTFWWRWEPTGFGHLWVSLRGKMYDVHPQLGYQAKDFTSFFQEEAQRGFHYNGAETFFVGLQMKMEPKDLDALETFFQARVTGRKADGTPIPQPAYVWDAPFVKDEITPGRCGMFATSYGNRAWQALFPELPLADISERYGLRYMDGSLFALHRNFQTGKAPRNLVVLGAERHTRPDPAWNLPVDALPDEVKETMRGAWSIGQREPFGP